jgi:sulfide:quinone oxidoreductase
MIALGAAGSMAGSTKLQSMSTQSGTPRPFEVIIAGGGVASLEAALALHGLAGDRVHLKLLAPNPEFVVRPMTVREPFAFGRARRYELAGIAGELGAELIEESLKSVAAEGMQIQTESGQTVRYDALLIALGARVRARYPYVITIDDRNLDELLHGLIQDVESGYVQRLGFVIPARRCWPLPVYELALMAARRAYDANVEVRTTILTPENAPLALFGEAVSRTVADLLSERGIEVIGSASCEVPEPGRVQVDGQRLVFDRIVALPELEGPAVAGLPAAEDGFIPIDEHAAVRGIERVYAAGDATDFPIKHGGIAAQQADAAAQAIAALAGVPVQPRPFSTVIQGMLLTGGRPLYMSARLTGDGAADSQVSEQPLWESSGKIAAQHLAGYLDRSGEVGS